MSLPSRSFPRHGGPPSGRSPTGQGHGLGRGGRSGTPQPSRQPIAKFRGNCTDLSGYIFDCSDYKQADTFVNTLKHISEEYVGAKYKNGGDIRSSIINEAKLTIPILASPQTPVDAPVEEVAKMIFKGELDEYIKRKSMLDDNIQKANSLVIGQCTDLLQSKLKQQANWSTISQDQDAIALICLIKTITFRFEDQKFLLLALYQSKANLYNLRQADMTNHEYLQRFQNLIDVPTAHNGQLHDQGIIDIACKRSKVGKFITLTADQQSVVKLAASNSPLQLCPFIRVTVVARVNSLKTLRTYLPKGTMIILTISFPPTTLSTNTSAIHHPSLQHLIPLVSLLPRRQAREKTTPARTKTIRGKLKPLAGTTVAK